MAQCLNLPPEQSSEYQVEIGGQIRLAGVGSYGVGTHDEQATIWEVCETCPHELPKTSLHSVANHCGANRTANDKAYLHRLTIGYHK